MVDKALVKFKIRKQKTDIVSEAKAQQSGQPYVKSSNEMKNGGVNILENILGESFGVYKEANNQQGNEQNKNDNRQRYPEVNNPPSSEDQMNENKIVATFSTRNDFD